MSNKIVRTMGIDVGKEGGDHIVMDMFIDGKLVGNVSDFKTDIVYEHKPMHEFKMPGKDFSIDVKLKACKGADKIFFSWMKKQAFKKKIRKLFLSICDKLLRLVGYRLDAVLTIETFELTGVSISDGEMVVPEGVIKDFKESVRIVKIEGEKCENTTKRYIG